MAKKRKTKEQKIIAQLRRELQGAKKELKQFKKEEVVKKKPEKRKSSKLSVRNAFTYASDARSPNPPPDLLRNSKQAGNLYLKKDLTRTLILSILAIGIELMIYWLTIKGFDIFNLPAQLKTKFF